MYVAEGRLVEQKCDKKRKEGRRLRPSMEELRLSNKNGKEKGMFLAGFKINYGAAYSIFLNILCSL
jgi:hypothetical protein